MPRGRPWEYVLAFPSRMKRILIALSMFLLLAPVPGAAQKRLSKNERLRLQELEIERLQRVADSLRLVIDSLTFEPTTFEDSLAVMEPEEERRAEAFDAAVTDSLLGEWYRQRVMRDYEEASRYNMDSVRFTSNVSDAELERRLKAMNSYITLPFNETVKNYMVLYSEKMPRHMGTLLGRSVYYFPIFEEIFAKYDIPLELKYMAVIESNFNPVARSRVGAMGMWQFMYNTARSYGLKINSFVDERLDVEKSADAAARYLKDAYDVFGDWCLAISSYNCGFGNVQKAIRRAGSRKFWDIYDYLPHETRGYMPAFVGAMYAFEYRNEYGLSAADVGLPVACDTFEIRKNLHFKQINETVGVPLEMLRQLNPQYTHDIIPGDEGTYVLQLPVSWTSAFLDVPRDTLYNHKSGELLNQQVLKNLKESGGESRIAYKVRSGDYLGKIASRYHVTVKQIKQWNHLRSDNLRIGQILYIYGRGGAPSGGSGTAKSSEDKKDLPAASGGINTAAGFSGEYTMYTVQSGDNLYDIAKKYPGVSARNIMDFNGMSSSKLRVGQKLKIPKP